MDGHRRLAGLEGAEDFLEAVIGRGGREDAVLAEQVDHVLAAGNPRLRGQPLLEVDPLAAEHEARPVVMAALAAAKSEAVDIGPAVAVGVAGQGLGNAAEFVAGGGHLEAELVQHVLAIVEIEHDILDRQVIGVAVGGTGQVEKIVLKAILAVPGVDLRADRLQRAHFDEARLREHLDHRRVGRVAADDRGVEIVVIAVPGNVLGLDLDARILGLELGDKGVHRVVGIVEMIPEADGAVGMGKAGHQRQRAGGDSDFPQYFHLVGSSLDDGPLLRRPVF